MARKEFEHFDLVNLARDHHYINSTKIGNPTTTTIMKEWRILKNNLPDSIYVQTYDTRIDLLRAVIIGPTGTPYHDGLFFFDILLPHNYPTNPPLVYYHSHGYRLNPNLYANGYVCLSLINTWSGTISEKWTTTSTILQLLVSIQGLVLNARPFFNEPGFKNAVTSKLPKWVNASDRYTEGAFFLSCSTMQHIVRSPPKGFEGFVLDHFRQRAAQLLAAILHYQEGLVVVGRFGMNSNEESCSICVSPSFKSNLEKSYAKLYKALLPLVPNLHVAVGESMMEVRRRKGGRVGSIIKKHENKVKERKEKLLRDQAAIVNNEKKGKKHKKGLLSKISSFVKKIMQ